jgi:hypothetical protein
MKLSLTNVKTNINIGNRIIYVCSKRIYNICSNQIRFYSFFGLFVSYAVPNSFPASASHFDKSGAHIFVCVNNFVHFNF